MHHARTISILAAAAFAAGLFVAPSALAADGLTPGQEAPVFALPLLNKGEHGLPRRLRLDDWIGADAKDKKKAVILSFFASYCEPCKREMPLLQKLHEDGKKKGLGVVLVSIDKDKAVEAELRALMAKSGVTFPVLSDRFNIVAKRYFIEKLPSLYGLAGDGKVAFHTEGFDPASFKNFISRVEKVLGAPLEVNVPSHGDATTKKGSDAK